MREFIKNIVFCDVDGLRGLNHYTVEAMYNVVGDDGFASIEYEKLDEFDYTWADIERDGGIAKIVQDFKDVYGEDCIR